MNIKDNFIIYFEIKPQGYLTFKNHNIWQEHPILLYYSVIASLAFNKQLDANIINIISRNIDAIELDPVEVTEFLQYIIEKNHVVEIFEGIHTLGLLNKIMPELAQLDHIQVRDGKEHKNAYTHSLGVLRNTLVMGIEDPVLRWAALFHDLGKLPTKKWSGTTWTYSNHAEASYYIVRNWLQIYPVVDGNDAIKLLTLVRLHMRPIVLVGKEITDSAIRRMITESSPYADDLIALSLCDVTTTNTEHRTEVYNNLLSVQCRMAKIKEEDSYRRVQLPMPTGEILERFGITRCREFTAVLNRVKHMIVDEGYPNEYTQVMNLLEKLLKESNLTQDGKS